MKIRPFKTLLALGGLAASSAAYACADSSCYPSWKLNAPWLSCENRAVLSPGNDTRVNLLFLLRDRAGLGSAGLSYPAQGYNESGFGRVFLTPAMLRDGFYPKPKAESPDQPYSGSRCAGYGAGSAALGAAMTANKGLPEAERTALMRAREAAEQVCKDGTSWERRYGDKTKDPLTPYAAWPTVKSASGQEFLGYLQAADAFYAEQWDRARTGFAAGAKARDPWVRETSAYMLARVELAAAQAAAFGDYGYYEGFQKVDQAGITRGRAALGAYLQAWPKGRYAASAQGLDRRGMWLAGDFGGLSREYARLLGAIDPASEAAIDLVQEIDNKLLFDRDAGTPAIEDPLMLAALDLKRMRDESYGDASLTRPAALTATDLAAQASRFAGHEELFSFLQANHAYYVTKDYRRVLQLVPDDARRPSYSNLAFSRQVLRGQALAALGDRNEAGFWLELLGGARQLWQRPTAELGLAMSWERSGKLAQVYAKDSPVTESMIRRELIVHSAGPAILRTAARDNTRPQYERDLALFVLLYKQLSRGDYAGFLADRTLVAKDANTDAGLWAIVDQEMLPLGRFVRGRQSDGYACPAIGETARTLAGNPSSIPARLCLGDFWRLNDFDGFDTPDTAPPKDQLGGVANEFPGNPLLRGDIYTAVIAEPKASANDKAYALYRAVMCYAPSGMNACGGKGVEQPQRKAWHDRLKRDFPKSVWAKKLRYYW